jgi:SOS-response transcriptional repressor LexA
LRGSSKVLSLPANKYVVVRITGDSMNKPGKLEEEAVDIGDYVLLRLQETADDGDMVAAEIIDVDSSATLKRFRVVQAGLKYSLEPQSTNPDHLPREFTAIDEGFHIRGVALAAFKPIKSTHENEPNHP